MDQLVSGIAVKLKESVHIDRHDLKLIVLGLLTGVFTHIYYMVNVLGSDDVIMRNYPAPVSPFELLNGAATGRWLGAFVDELQSWYRSYYVAGWIILLTVALIAVLLIHIFQIHSTVGQILTIVLLETFPATQANVVLGEISYPIAFLFATFAAWLIIRENARIGSRIGSLVFLSLSLVIMPTAMSCYLTVLLIWIIEKIAADSSKSLHALGKWAWQQIVILLAAGIFLLLSSLALIKITGIGLTSYQGAASALNGAFLSNIGTSLIQVYKKFIVQGLWKMQIIPSLRFTFYVAYLIDGICLFVLWQRIRTKVAKLRIIVAGLGVILLPITTCTITLVSYGFMYKGQHRFPLAFLLVGTIMLLERVFEDVNLKTAARKYRILGSIGLLNLSLMIYGFWLFDNIGYQVQAYVMQQDSTLCTRILAYLDTDAEFDYSDPVYFLNITTWDETQAATAMKYDPEMYSVIWPVATTNLYCYGDESVRAHMYNYEGVNFVRASLEEQAAIENSGLKDTYADLQVGDFEVTQYDGVTVVVIKTVMPPSVLYG